ncbi:MAG: RsmB/NOP family class I SAM-dependent RNA methyltransferase [Candidatus Paracaedimonas acanthamoebae]|uniref:RsmB/NOP family class I SAM-dependent RNA methyltransferase n=1 Tax=Candidatus Paracaedimonas acanthamoebae TaxID=244581 RepID=A0A8J7TTQ3_9PROT|nr:RsmB/NOP family class I SAM-dependent RNA methyltransferase [Candidatus Paracaedimonas acanthamoebae]
MTPGAQVAAALDLLEHAITVGEKPFDVIITHYFKQRRYAGSQDRRTILELVYGVLRNFYKLFYVAQEKFSHEVSARLYLLAYLKLILDKKEVDLDSLFSGIGYAPSKITPPEQNFFKNLQAEIVKWPEWAHANIPEFLWPEVQNIFGVKALSEAESLNQEATVDLRVNPLKTNRDFIKKSLESENIESIETLYSPLGLRLKKRVNLTNHPLYQQGLFEFQDEASQLVSILCDVQGNETVLDYCAGAGGKTLALAGLMDNKGHIDAYDVSSTRLRKAELRAQRTGCQNVHFLTNVSDRTYDRVLIDAPCSGTGTWRRHPEWRVTITPENLKKFISLQKEIIFKAVQNVKTGGRLIYVTCSLLACENEEIMENFLENHSEFKAVPISGVWEKLLKVPCPTASSFLRFTPHQHKTDGFFIAIFEKK